MSPPLDDKPPLVGVLVGGKATRMGGAAKGLLSSPGGGGSLVDALRRKVTEALPDAELVLVGARREYGALGLRMIADDERAAGPLAGLVALLNEAKRLGNASALLIACDMPYISASLIARLARQEPRSAALAPLLDQRWQPMFARYPTLSALTVCEALIASGRSSVYPVLDALKAHTLPLSTAEEPQLQDWDAPEDLLRTNG